MLLEGRVGPVQLSDGVDAQIRLGRGGQVITSGYGDGSYTELVKRGQVYFACTQSGIATTAGLGTSATGIILTNPVSSGKNVVVLRFHGAITAAPGGAAPLGLALQTLNSGAISHTTPLTVRNAKGGAASAGIALADSAATLAAVPVFIWPIQTIIAASSITPTVMHEEIGGQIILTPGTALSTFTLTTALSGLWAFYWTEVDE